ncbi:MAG: hypothetical protein Crog4KO_15300 [Crocinitomicaceae bacterium]
MKLAKKVLIMAFTFSATYSYSTHYTSINGGSWNDNEIWSTDGGTTQCFCVPPTSLNGDSVTVQNDVILTGHLLANTNSQLNVSTSGSLNGTGRRLSVLSGGEINISGPANFSRLTNGATNGTNGGTINIISSIVQLAGPIRAYAGTINISGYLYQTTGNMQIGANGTVNFSSGAKFESFGGNITNEGTLDICSDCCMTTSGNWTNESSGTVNGNGAATSIGGNMNNFGSFSPAITWCSAGFDTGMPSAEDCSTSTTTCSMIVLPVELSAFSGVALENYNLLTWVTESENNCMNFVITSSSDGYIWEPIGTVDCAGNSTTQNFYEFKDFNRTDAISYYRLEQVDVDGSVHRSQPVSVSRKVNLALTSYPNPIKAGQNIFVSGINGQGNISILNANGRMVYNHELTQQDGAALTIPAQGFSSGMYIIQFVNESEVQTTRFLVQ